MNFPSVNIIAVTASATKDVVEDIQLKLDFKNANVFRQSFERKNIRYVVQIEENKYELRFKLNFLNFYKLLKLSSTFINFLKPSLLS